MGQKEEKMALAGGAKIAELDSHARSDQKYDEPPGRKPKLARGVEGMWSNSNPICKTKCGARHALEGVRFHTIPYSDR